MTEGHLTPEHTSKIVEDNRLSMEELEHVRHCASCNGWLRAFAALASAASKKIEFRIPPAPDSNYPTRN